MSVNNKSFGYYIIVIFIYFLPATNVAFAKELQCVWSSGKVNKEFIKWVPKKKTFYTNQFKKNFFGGKSMVASMSCPKLIYSLQSEKK